MNATDFSENENVENVIPADSPSDARLKKKKQRRRIMFWSLMGVVALTMVLGNYGAYEIYKIKNQKTVLEREIERLQQIQIELIRNKERAKSDLAYIEKIAREKYSMIREGERVYQVIPKSKQN